MDETLISGLGKGVGGSWLGAKFLRQPAKSIRQDPAFILDFVLN
jgi:hypothetical protein